VAAGQSIGCEVGSCDRMLLRDVQADLSFRMGYQKKGYTSGKIGIAWLKDWDKQTKAKAGGQA